MLPTYTVCEIKHLIRSLDASEITILTDLVNDEISCYPSYESRAIFRMINLQKQAISGNEVIFEFLLAYN